ncbi:MAG: HEPN domain-containing protein, partial [Nitrospiraceae bacterium]
MKGQTEALLAKATENLLASQDLLRSGHPEIAVSRSYYTMFYAAEGALVEEGLE